MSKQISTVALIHMMPKRMHTTITTVMLDILHGICNGVIEAPPKGMDREEILAGVMSIAMSITADIEEEMAAEKKMGEGEGMEDAASILSKIAEAAAAEGKPPTIQ